MGNALRTTSDEAVHGTAVRWSVLNDLVAPPFRIRGREGMKPWLFCFTSRLTGNAARPGLVAV